MIKYICHLVVVDDIDRSRTFYEKLLGQKVTFDFGQNIQFEGGFSIHLKSHYQSLLGEVNEFPILTKSHWGEIYFESEDLEPVYQHLVDKGIEFVHPIREQPWGQRVMRFYDPDGHIIEIGESMETVVLRFHKQGLSKELICEKSAMPYEFVEGVINQYLAE